MQEMQGSEHDEARMSVDQGGPSRDEASVDWTPVLTLADVAKESLGLDPDLLALLDPREGGDPGDPSRGFNVLVRRALAHALALRDDAAPVIRLMSEKAARANGWPDARTANVAAVISWAMVDDTRWVQRLPTVPLMPADDPAEEALPSATGAEHGLATGLDLFEAFRRRVLDETRPRGDATGTHPADGSSQSTPPARPEGTPVASTNAVIRQVLGLEPRELADMYDRREYRWPGTSFEADPETAGRVGLLHLVRDAFVHVKVMRKRDPDAIRLMSDFEAREDGWADSRAPRFSILLAAALTHGAPRDITFLPAREPRPEREDLLKAVAKEVYFFGSEATLEAFELLCDDGVRFGVDRVHDKSRRLLWQVGEEHDPQGLRLREMPEWIELSLAHFRGWNEAVRRKPDGRGRAGGDGP